LTSAPSSQLSPARLATWLYRHRFLLLAILALWLIFFLLPGVENMPLLEPDEGRNAEVAREMLRGGDWITPHYNGYPYLDKPAPFFWLVAATFKVFGVSEWAARLPSGLAALATMLLIGLLARRMFGPEESLASALVLATSPLFLIFARQVIFDMTLTFLITVALVCFWWDEQRPARRLSVDMMMFLAMGLATITKGPVGFLLPLLAILVYSLVRGGLARFQRLHWGWGLIAFLAAALPWFIAVSVRNPDFPRYALWQESLVRFTTGSARRSGSFFYYLPVYLGGFFPWSFLLLYACLSRLKSWKELREETNAPIAFLISFVIVVFVFFTISRSKLPGYFLPALGPLSLLVARLWVSSKSGETGRMPDWLTASFATLIAVGLLMILAPRFEHLQFVHTRLEKKISPSLVELVKVSMLFSGIVLAALGVLGRDLAARAKRKVPSNALFAVLLLATPVAFLQWAASIKRYAAYSSSRWLAEEILSSPQRDLPIYGYYYFRTSLPFYLQRPVGLVTTGAEEMTSNYVVSRWPNIPAQTEKAGFASDLAAAGEDDFPGPLVFEKDWSSKTRSSPVLVFVRNGLVPNLFKSRGTVDPLWTRWDFSVWEIPASVPQPNTLK
jgi:4-amino-4-deoxy-L-arabinose transferase-like glycosyltransferase